VRHTLAGMSRRPKATLTRSVAPGIHRIDHAYVNCYLVEDGDSVTLVDGGLPATWRFILQALDAIGRRPEDVSALVLTHAHFDHVGTARRFQREIGGPVHVHPLDAFIARHPYRYSHERARGLYPLLFPRALPVLASMTVAGALSVPGISGTRPMPGGGVLDVPGTPTILFTPGHTEGHCALHFPERDAVITGDALVTLDPYTGETGPRIVAGAATADSPAALASLQKISATGAGTLLPGHGSPWRGDPVDAVAEATGVGAR
jgi:glyoxylase-like metal-dependent hydrolase (beta-lactamase superfamily II)